MASQQALDGMNQVVVSLKNIDRNKLLRPTIGEESLEQAGFGKTLDTVLQKATFAHQYGRDVDESVFNAVTSVFTNLRSILDTQAKRPNAEYVQQKTNVIGQVDGTVQQIRQYWPHFVASAVEARGFLEDEGIRKEYQKTVDDMKAQADTALKLVREESSKTIGEAKKLAEEIEQRARRTAAHISVEEAQKQFKEAQGDLDRQVTLWTIPSRLSRRLPGCSLVFFTDCTSSSVAMAGCVLHCPPNHNPHRGGSRGHILLANPACADTYESSQSASATRGQ